MFLVSCSFRVVCFLIAAQKQAEIGESTEDLVMCEAKMHLFLGSSPDAGMVQVKQSCAGGKQISAEITYA